MHVHVKNHLHVVLRMYIHVIIFRVHVCIRYVSACTCMYKRSRVQPCMYVRLYVHIHERDCLMYEHIMLEYTYVCT